MLSKNSLLKSLIPIAIILLFGVVYTASKPVELTRSEIKNVIELAIRDATEATSKEVDLILSGAYEPVYHKIPDYEEFYYSFWGEYEGIKNAVLGELADSTQERLFNDFEEDFLEASRMLGDIYAEEYKDALNQRVREEITRKKGFLGRRGENTRKAIETALDYGDIGSDILFKAIIQKSGTEVSRVIAQKITGKILKKISAKLAAKGVARLGGVLSGFGTGTAACGWLPPAVPFCSIAGAVAGWFLSDLTVLKIDEFFTREDFREELTTLINEDKIEKQKLIRDVLRGGWLDANFITNEAIKSIKLYGN